MSRGGRPAALVGGALVLVLVAAAGFVVGRWSDTLDPDRALNRPLATQRSDAPRLVELVPPGSDALFIGDSYAAGVGADQPANTWVTKTAAALGWTPTVDAVDGTGFTFGGGARGEAGQDYLTRVRSLAGTPSQFDVVVLEGGQNDLRADRSLLLRDTGQVVAAVREAWPGAVVIVLGPCAPQPLQHVLDDTASSIDAAARAAGAYSVNPAARGWFTEANSPGYDFDHTHVNSAGHAYIAERLVQAIKGIRQITPS